MVAWTLVTTSKIRPNIDLYAGSLHHALCVKFLFETLLLEDIQKLLRTTEASSKGANEKLGQKQIFLDNYPRAPP